MKGAPRSLALLSCLIASCASPAPAGSVPPPQTLTPRFAIGGTPQQGALLIATAPAGARSVWLDGKPVPVGAGGRFILGFDRDHPTASTLTAELADGRTVSETVTVSPGAWRTEHVNVAQRPRVPDEEYQRIRKGELERIGAARAVNAASEGWRQRFIWPTKGRISGVFGSQRIYRGEPGSFHTGVDVAPGAGTPVVAPADGMVVLAGPPMFTLEGNLVIVDHGMGLNSAFLHLASVNVRQGQAVKQGQLIGTVGSSGRATGPHLHWSMKWRDARIDPQALAGPMN